MAGRKKIPTKLKVLKGTQRVDRFNPDEPQPDLKMPTPPEHLSREALVEWGRVSNELYKLGLLSEIDRVSLACYCQAYGRWVQAEKKLEEHGKLVDITPNGMQQQHALVGVANKAMELVYKFNSEFGMSPASRAKVSVKKKDDGKKKNPFSKIG